MNKPNFDICLITRNESKTLPRLFKSLQEFKERGGQIDICDTGSIDNTVQIAKEFGCNVIEVGDKFRHTITKEQADQINDRFIIENEMNIVNEGDSYFDFASARNEAVSISREDWVCTVDADEILTKLDIDKINEVIANPKLGALEYNFVFSHLPDGSELIKFIQSKFYNKHKMEWVGIIHEMVTPKGQGGERAFVSEDIFKLEHWQNPETNRTGYLKGLAVDCFNHQEKDRNSHYFARELWWNGRPWSAAKEFKRHIEMNCWPAERAESMLFLADIYGAMEKSEEQLYWCHRAVDTEPNRREGLLKLAQIYQRRNQPIPANFYAIASLELPWYPFYGANKTFYENEPHEILYWAKGWLGDIKGAQEHILKCLDYQRENPKYLHDTKYYFDYPANNITGWMSYREQLFLFETARRMDSVIELGSWKGKSTHALCSSGCPKVTAIDTWMGSIAEPSAHAQAKDGSVFEEFKRNVGHFTNLTYIQKDINDAVLEVEDKSVDMIFIDAGHTYEEVKNDIRKWKSKARICLCGHDYCGEWEGVKQAVDEELGGPDELHGSIWVKWINKPKVSICIPTLGRPEKLHRLLESIKELGGYDNYEIIVKSDEPQPNNIGAPKMLAKCVEESTGDLVLFLGNDCVAKSNFIQEAVWDMIRQFPDLDGMIGINDGYWDGDKGQVAAHWLASKKLLPYLGGNFFDTDFYHTGVDNLLQARCEKIGKYHWCRKAEIFHDQPMMSGKMSEMDSMYQEAYCSPRHDHDNKLYLEKMKEYGLEERKF